MAAFGDDVVAYQLLCNCFVFHFCVITSASTPFEFLCMFLVLYFVRIKRLLLQLSFGALMYMFGFSSLQHFCHNFLGHVWLQVEVYLVCLLLMIEPFVLGLTPCGYHASVFILTFYGYLYLYWPLELMVFRHEL